MSGRTRTEPPEHDGSIPDEIAAHALDVASTESSGFPNDGGADLGLIDLQPIASLRTRSRKPMATWLGCKRTDQMVEVVPVVEFLEGLLGVSALAVDLGQPVRAEGAEVGDNTRRVEGRARP